MLELDCGYEFEAARDVDFFEALPTKPGVLRLEIHDANAQPYLARTSDIRRATERLLQVPDPASKRLNLRDVAARIRYRVTGSKFEQSLSHYQNARLSFPGTYSALTRLRPSALLKVNLRNDYPRCYVTRKIAPGGFYFGPFPSRRSAETFSEGFLDLFKIRRCQIKIQRDPQFPGCVYSEMKMCLAPCFAGCTKREYDMEVARLVQALQSTGASLVAEFKHEREVASEALDFERAAVLHKRLEKVSAALRNLPDLARRIDELDAVILQRGADTKTGGQTVIAFPVRTGLLTDPVFLRFGELSSEPRSIEAILRNGLEPPAAGATKPSSDDHLLEQNLEAPSSQESPANQPMMGALRAAPRELSEHLSLLARWFYSNPREGEIFFRQADWPYRRILRACGRLLAPPKTPPPSPATESISPE